MKDLLTLAVLYEKRSCWLSRTPDKLKFTNQNLRKKKKNIIKKKKKKKKKKKIKKLIKLIKETI